MQDPSSNTNPSRQKLYQGLSEKFDIGTFKEFNRKMDSPESRRRLFKAASGSFDLGDFQTFEQKIAPTTLPAPSATQLATPQEPAPLAADQQQAVTRLTSEADFTEDEASGYLHSNAGQATQTLVADALKNYQDRQSGKMSRNIRDSRSVLEMLAGAMPEPVTAPASSTGVDTSRQTEEALRKAELAKLPIGAFAPPPTSLIQGDTTRTSAERITVEESAEAGAIATRILQGDTPETAEHFVAGRETPIARMGRSFATGVIGIPQGIARAPEAMGLDSETFEAGLSASARAAGLPAGLGSVPRVVADTMQEWIDAIAVENPSFAEQLSSGAGSQLGFWIPGMGLMKGAQLFARFSPKAAAWAGTGLSTILESGVEAANVYDQSIRSGKTKEEAETAAQQTFGVNTLLVGITNKLGIFGEGKTALANVLRTAPIESIQEIGQQITSNVALGQDPYEGVLESGLIGAILGGTGGALLGGTQEPRPKAPPQPAPRATVPEVPPQSVTPLETPIPAIEEPPTTAQEAPQTPPKTVPASPWGEVLVNRAEKEFQSSLSSKQRFPLSQYLTKEASELVSRSPSLQKRFEKLVADAIRHNASIPTEESGTVPPPSTVPAPQAPEGKPTGAKGGPVILGDAGKKQRKPSEDALITKGYDRTEVEAMSDETLLQTAEREKATVKAPPDEAPGSESRGQSTEEQIRLNEERQRLTEGTDWKAAGIENPRKLSITELKRAAEKFPKKPRVIGGEGVDALKKQLVDIATTGEGTSAEGILRARELAEQSKDLFTTEQRNEITTFLADLQEQLKERKPDKPAALTQGDIAEQQAKLTRLKERTGKTIEELYPTPPAETGGEVIPLEQKRAPKKEPKSLAGRRVVDSFVDSKSRIWSLQEGENTIVIVSEWYGKLKRTSPKETWNTTLVAKGGQRYFDEIRQQWEKTKPAPAKPPPETVEKKEPTPVETAKPITLYRGSSQRGNWLTPDKGAAQEYADLWEKGEISSSTITPKKLATKDDVLRVADKLGLKDAPEQAEYHLLSPETYAGAEKIIEGLRREGYDFVRVAEDFAPSGKAIESYLDLTKPPAETVGRQAWEMTREEYLYAATTDATKRHYALPREKQPIGGPNYVGIKESAWIKHGRLIREALSEGKSIPPEVLKDYPDFVKPAEETTEPPAETQPSRLQVSDVPLSEIKTDVDAFQNREMEFSEESVKKLSSAINEGKFNLNEFDPILLWQDPDNNQLFVLSGHSRAEAFRQASKAGKEEFSSIPAKIIKGVSKEEAQEIAKRSNVLGTRETPVERANYYRRLRDQGKSEKEAIEEARKFEGKNATQVIGLSYLNPRGKALDAVRALEGADQQSRGNAFAMAEWIGEVRRRYPELTNSHEGELYDFLKDSYGKTGARNKTEFLERVTGTIERRTEFGQFDATKPLNIKNLATKSTNEQGYDERLESAKAGLDKAEKERDIKLKSYIERDVPQERLEGLMKPFNDAVTVAQREVVRLTQNKADALREIRQSEISLFDDISKELTDEQISNAEGRTRDQVEELDPVIKTLETETTAAEDIADLTRQQDAASELLDTTEEHLDRVTSGENLPLLSRTQVREQIRNSLPESISDEIVDGYMAILDARAQTWAAQTGNDADLWYRSRIAGVRQGGELPDNALFQYIGENAELKQSVRDDLRAAQLMENAGKSDNEIRIATGWFRNQYDNKWRYEIPTDQAKAKLSELKIISDKGIGMAEYRLDDVLDFPELFDAYPPMGSIKVEFSNFMGKNVGASFNPASATIRVNYDALHRITARGFEGTLFHEIQHAIQFVEGFAAGANLSRYLPYNPGSYAEDDPVILAAYKDAMDKYWRTAGEIEARDVEKRKFLGAEYRRSIAPFSYEDIAPSQAIVLMEGGLQESQESGSIDPMSPKKGSGKTPTGKQTPQPEGRKEPNRDLSADFDVAQLFSEIMKGGGIKATNQTKYERLSGKLQSLLDDETKEMLNYLRTKASGPEELWKISAEVKGRTEEFIRRALIEEEIKAETAKHVPDDKVPFDLLGFALKSAPRSRHENSGLRFDIKSFNIELDLKVLRYYQGKTIYANGTDLMLAKSGDKKLVEVWEDAEDAYEKTGKYIPFTEIKEFRWQRPVWVANVSGNAVSAESFAQKTGYKNAIAGSARHLILREATRAEVETIGEQWLEEWNPPSPDPSRAPERGAQGSNLPPNDPNILFQSKETAPPFFSALQKSVEDLKQEKWSPDQLLGKLRSTPGVKPDELKWTGLDDLLSSRTTPITRKEVLDFLNENRVEVQEVVKGGMQFKKGELPNNFSIRQKPDGWFVKDPYSGSEIYGTTREEAIEHAQQYHRDAYGEGAPSKFSQWVLPGAKEGTYRELLLTLPVEDRGISRADIEAQARTDAGAYWSQYTERQRADAIDDVRRRFNSNQLGAFRSTHFDEPNILAHVRFNERTDAQGKRMLFIEEIQSDWHSKGRKEGYSENPKEEAQAKQAFDEYAAKLAKRYGLNPLHNLAMYSKIKDMAPAEVAQYEKLQREWLRYRGTGRKVPNAPFKSTWQELSLRRMVRYAAENGFSSIGWTTGEQQAERYDLSKQVKHIAWEKNDDGTYNINAPLPNGEPGIYKEDLTIQDVEELIGKDIAKRITNEEGTESKESKYRDWKILEGENLKVGGIGMKGFYDKILVDYANKLGKKWGAKVESVTIKGDNAPEEVVKQFEAQDPGHPLVKKNRMPVHVLPITPSMRDDALRLGFPLFQGKLGAVHFLADARAMIHAFEGANVSTVIHEIGHIFRRDLYRAAKEAKPGFKAQIEADIKSIEEWAGVKDGNWGVGHEERFARAFERYVREGKAPTAKLEPIFQRFKEWLTEVYRSIKGSAIDVKITPDVRKVFDRLLAVQEKPARPRTQGRSTRGPQAQVVDTGLPMRPVEQTDFTESDLDKISTLRQIGQNLANALEKTPGKDVRIGLIKRFKRRALGIFFPQSGLIRLRNINDLDTFAHELGHDIDFTVFQFSDKIRFNKADNIEKILTLQLGRYKNDPAKRAKLLDSLRKKYGASVVDEVGRRYELRKELKDMLLSYHYPNVNVEEGVAEFVRKYVIEPEFVIERTPKFFSFFENLLGANPNIQKALLTARREFKEYAAQDPRKIIESTVQRNPKESLLDGIKDVAGKLEYNLIDAVKPFRDLTGELLKVEPNLPAMKNPIIQTLSVLGIEGKVKQYLENHPFQRDGKEIRILKDQPGLLTIFDRMIKEGTLKSHEGYLIALRNLELIENGKAAAATTTKEIAEKAKALYEKQLGKDYLEGLVNQLREYNNSLLEYYQASGKISPEILEAIKELNQYYIPFKRFFDEYESTGTFPAVSKVLRDTSPTPVKGIKGSQREILPPVESLIQNTYDLIMASDKNYALTAIVEGMQKIDPKLVQEIPRTTVKPVRIFQDGELSEIKYTLVTEKPKDSEIITIWNNGKPTFYQVPKQYYDSFFGLYEPYSKAIQLLGIPTQVLRAGAVVYDPTFGVRNISRDQMSAIFYSKHGYNPIDFFHGLHVSVNKAESYQKFLASGADLSFLAVSDKALAPHYSRDAAGSHLTTLRKRYLSVNGVWRAFEDFNRATELGTRVGAFRNVYLKTGDVYQAMEEARRIGGDYSIRGAGMKNITPLYAFLNARIRHAVNVVQSFGPEQAAHTLKVGMLYMAPAAALNWLFNNYDDEDEKLYDGLPAWRKYAFFNIRIPGTESFLPIPKGFYGVLFGSGTEAVLDWIKKDDPRAVKGLAGQLFEEFSPLSSLTDFAPQIIRPPVELFANRSGYTGQPIVSQGLEKLEPAEQFTEGTPEIIKEIGSALNMSPKKIEAFLYGYTAGVGRNTIYITDEILQMAGIVDRKPSDTFKVLTRLPVSKAFVSEPPLGLRDARVEQFYEKLDELEQMNATANNFIKRDEADKLKDYLADKMDDYSFYVKNQTEINRFKDFIRSMGDLQNEILNDESPPDRREKAKESSRILSDVALAFSNSYRTKEQFRLSAAAREILKSYSRGKRKDQKAINRFKKETKREAMETP